MGKEKKRGENRDLERENKERKWGRGEKNKKNATQKKNCSLPLSRRAHHVVPVGHDPVLDRVLERQDPALGLRLVADVGVLLAHADHHALVARAADDRGEDGAWRVVAGEAGLDHAGAVVADEGGDLAVVSHCVWMGGGIWVCEPVRGEEGRRGGGGRGGEGGGRGGRGG